MIKGILFDKDGTLLDFNAAWLGPYIQASEYIASCVGRLEISESLLRKGGYIPETEKWVPDSLFASGSNDQIIAFWESEVARPLSELERSRIREIFALAANNYIPVLANMGDFLDELKQRNIRIGLATMDDEKNAHGMLAKLQLEGKFDFICGADSGHGVKPESGMIDAFCRQCNLSVAEVIMVGDSPRDLTMGKNAGVALTVGVLTGAHGREELARHGDYVYDDISGLEQLLNSYS